jgi:hypothetical protein
MPPRITRIARINAGQPDDRSEPFDKLTAKSLVLLQVSSRSRGRGPPSRDWSLRSTPPDQNRMGIEQA